LPIGMPQTFPIVIVALVILMIVPDIIASLTANKLFKAQSKSVRITLFAIILSVSFVLELFALGIGYVTPFHR
jgi:hypothetical protein